MKVKNIELIEQYVLKQRGFNTVDYLQKKKRALKHFFDTNQIDTVVLGMSGGLDSTVVHALLHSIVEDHDSALTHIVPVVIPITGVSGIKNQKPAAQRAINYLETKNSKYLVHDLGYVAEHLATQIQSPNAWAAGQMQCILRTPILYGVAANEQANGRKSLVCGTTNKDEGSYIGFFGKASDAMVDLQPIADIHKHEVRALGKYLGITQEIFDIAPTGDCWDGRNDEQMIGAPYWFLSLYLLLKENNALEIFDWVLLPEELEMCDRYAQAIEVLHRVNAHKYKVGNPAVFVNVLNVAVPGGWNIPVYECN